MMAPASSSGSAHEVADNMHDNSQQQQQNGNAKEQQEEKGEGLARQGQQLAAACAAPRHESDTAASETR
jgi:hypothetical protein